ncbi:hypothetical protein [Sinorhizobium meliloti]|uniref:hypothetical protein n=1 Tax=Rhizobium meliloti TaxID=382 RepID=UPI00129513E5|nr:hypothetical protein [Sinorhizobium meliloti]
MEAIEKRGRLLVEVDQTSVAVAEVSDRPRRERNAEQGREGILLVGENQGRDFLDLDVLESFEHHEFAKALRVRLFVEPYVVAQADKRRGNGKARFANVPGDPVITRAAPKNSSTASKAVPATDRRRSRFLSSSRSAKSQISE